MAGRVAHVSASLALLILWGCRKDAPETPPVAATDAKLEVVREAGWLFTYATPEGKFETAAAAEDVPPGSRAIVRAQNPEKEGPRVEGQVWAVDLDRLIEKGRAPAKLVPRALFETQALALLPPGASSILAERPEGADKDPQAAPQPSPGGARTGKVVLYGTSWCGACRSARQYFIARKIPFVDKDVEKDPAAADELQKKAAQLGVSADRVPVLDVMGRLLVGFDPKRVEALLGETI